MAKQLVLLEPDGEYFRIDERTREIGRRGVAEVRRILSEKMKSSTEHAGQAAAA